MSKLSIIYEDIPVGAKENSTITVTDKQDFSNLEQLKQEVAYKNYGTCEKNQFILDGTYELFPDDPTTEVMCLWSNSMTGESCDFAAPLVLNSTLDALYKSVGVSFSFADGYCSRLQIKWFRNDLLLSEMEFTPNNEMFFCQNSVEDFNKVQITFYSWSRPYAYLKLIKLDYGVIRKFYDDELQNVSTIEEISPISEEITINTLDFVLNSKTDTEFIFQSKQPLKLIFDGITRGIYFIDKFKRTAPNIYKIGGVDYIGLMDKTTFAGGIYENKNAFALAGEIFGNIPFEMSNELKTKTVTGYLPIDSQRNACMQLAFAIGGVVDTSRGDKVRIFTLDSTVKKHFTNSEVFYGQAFNDTDKVTGVRLTEHKYTQIEETKELFKGVGTNLYVKFDEPVWALSIVNGTILQSHSNYAILNASTGCVLSGKAYNHSTVIKEQKNPLVSATDLENIVSIENATLISENNSNDILVKIYEFYKNQGKSSIKLISSDVKVGDCIEYDTVYLGVKKGIVTSMRYGLNGNTIVAECEVLDVDI